ncbi:polysaccharide pyruvyl transferase CsaB [Paenibacillus bovis]|uniref:Polysaccharide pyruvyl transferase CsaB n=1 Tax=Paenibacillus bovis TaxID=1616788 RepID=A0A172ZMP9_9BACL|nr:polysaccharide pyruvyl transferase CsaB [Paenibacillus bovis]ANF98507.1 polysaccharide pyruvyl transferase CsaB [Paenibacillus bovis]
MASVSVQIVISGYYGFRNSGDEAVLKSILNSLAAQEKEQGIRIVPVVLSNDPEWTSRMYGVRSVQRMKLGEIRQLLKESDGLISGGGSLLQDSTGLLTIPYYLGIVHIAQWVRKPVFIYAQGVGPVQRPFFFKWIRNVFRKSAYISVRDQESASLLGRMGIDSSSVEVVADPVMGLPLPDGNSAASSTASHGSAHQAAETASYSTTDSIPVIGISVRFWDKQRRELDGIAEGLKLLSSQRPVHLRFLPFHLPDDEQASRYVIDKIGDISGNGSIISTADQVTDPQQMLAEVSRCHMLLGMRLHSLIYAASQSVPLMGISYDPKIDQFLNRMQIKPTGTSSVTEPARLVEDAVYLLDHGQEWQTNKLPLIQALQQDAARPAHFIAQYFLAKR